MNLIAHNLTKKQLHIIIKILALAFIANLSGCFWPWAKKSYDIPVETKGVETDQGHFNNFFYRAGTLALWDKQNGTISTKAVIPAIENHAINEWRPVKFGIDSSAQYKQGIEFSVDATTNKELAEFIVSKKLQSAEGG